MGLIEAVKRKKELSFLDDDIILEWINRLRLKEDSNSKSAAFKKSVKELRAKLREFYGLYQIDVGKRKKLLADIKSLEDEDAHKKLLKTHLSTKERLPFYERLYKEIFNITGKPISILDLGCGLNPISYPYLGFDVNYIASEFNSKDVEFLQEYFDRVKVNGKAIKINLLKDDFSNEKADVTFLWKVLDNLESIDNNCSERILKMCNSKWIVVSFPKLTVSGKEMKRSYNWFLKLVKDTVKLEFSNEVFFIFYNGNKVDRQV